MNHSSLQKKTQMANDKISSWWFSTLFLSQSDLIWIIVLYTHMKCQNAFFKIKSYLSLSAFIFKSLPQTLTHSPLYYCLENLISCSTFLMLIPSNPSLSEIPLQTIFSWKKSILFCHLSLNVLVALSLSLSFSILGVRGNKKSKRTLRFQHQGRWGCH